MDKKMLSVILFLLSALIAIYIVISHKAPWVLIAIYWLTLTYKNGADVDDN